jgi:hypothetical protein
MENG